MITKALVMAMILIESAGNPTAQSPQQALGLMQLTEIAIKEVQAQHNLNEDVNIFNPAENVKYGILLFEYYYRRTGSITRALVAYNGGYAALERYRLGGIDALPTETREYLPKVLGLARSLDPMFARQIPERGNTYLRDAIDTAFDDLYGVGPECDQVVFSSGVLPPGISGNSGYLRSAVGLQ